MRGRNKNNETQTRQLCKNICNVTGLSSLMTKNFLIIVQEALVHKIAEEALASTTGKIEYTDIELPYIGCIHITFDGRGSMSTTVELEDEMKQVIRNARNKGESPLVKHLEESVVKNISSQYQMLL